MPRLAVLLIAVSGIGAAGCQSSSSPDDTGNLLDNGLVTPLVHEGYTGFGEPARLVVRDSEQWADVWARTFVARSEVPQRPAIDFSKEMVLVAAQGAQGSGGYDISIDRVAPRNGAIAVDITSTSPDQRCGTLAVITSPVMMVRIRQSTSHVQFIEHVRVMRCE
jgi:hypothetical protein